MPVNVMEAFLGPYLPNIVILVTAIKWKRCVTSHFSACWASHRYGDGCGVCTGRKWAHLRFPCNLVFMRSCAAWL